MQPLGDVWIAALALYCNDMRASFVNLAPGPGAGSLRFAGDDGVGAFPNLRLDYRAGRLGPLGL